MGIRCEPWGRFGPRGSRPGRAGARHEVIGMSVRSHERYPGPGGPGGPAGDGASEPFLMRS